MDTSILHRDTWVEIQIDHIEHNCREIRKWLPPEVRFMATVKADAYGHGDLQVAEIALRSGADSLAVALLSEALYLRRNGVQAPILVLMPILACDVNKAIEQNISVTIAHPTALQEMLAYQTHQAPLKVHVKLDTGLGRIGIRNEAELQKLLSDLKRKEVIVEGVYTHYATAKRVETDYYDMQHAKLLEMIDWLEKEGVKANVYHCANSAAALQFPDQVLDMVRIGEAMLGFYPSLEIKRKLPFTLKSALSFHSKIGHIKQIKKGDYVGYDTVYQAQEEEWVATIPVGYADGYHRCFHGFYVLVDGQRMPIISTICMDQMMIRLPKEYPLGTEVVLIGKQGEEEITFQQLAEHIGSVPPEIPSMITDRVPKVYFAQGEIVEILSEKIWVNAPTPSKETIFTQKKASLDGNEQIDKSFKKRIVQAI
ncbi:alanine racemase [Bacillus horti]|uniref:Alanine racemase n=1 Tax=Caldalkalibacillus horti TaxID=77523 RepID=A0ABT9VYI1_9BACI|nr:alanine racemase [Bacillus horti]MDQ0165887.1 alanine racemase [Bacillus horti]